MGYALAKRFIRPFPRKRESGAGMDSRFRGNDKVVVLAEYHYSGRYQIYCAGN